MASLIVDNIDVSPYFSQAWEAEVLGTARFYNGGERVSELGAAAYIDNETCAWYIMSGVYGVFRRWVRNGMQQDVESLARTCTLLGLRCGGVLYGNTVPPEYLRAIEQWHLG